MVSNVTHKGRRHAVWVGRLSPPMEVLLFLQEGGLHSQGKTEDPNGSLINCYHYFVSGVPRGASCPSRAVLYTSAFNNVFDSTALRRTISLSCKISAGVAIFLPLKEKAPKKEGPFCQHCCFLIPKGIFCFRSVSCWGGKKVFFEQTLPFLPLSAGIALFPSGDLSLEPTQRP